jgi:regulator of replication initiation timing
MRWVEIHENDENDNSQINIDRMVDRVVANLKSYKSQTYTKLGQKLQRIDQLTAEIEKLKQESKSEARELVADLFDAEDVVRTRVVKTISFTFTLGKNPKATETYKYAQILSELEKSLTPELITVLEGLKEQFKSVVQKEPILRYEKNESVNEGVGERLKSYYAKVKNLIINWSVKYDDKLRMLMQLASN